MTLDELYNKLDSLYPNVRKTNIMGIGKEWNGIHVVFDDASISIQCTAYHYCNLRDFFYTSVDPEEADAKSIYWRSTATDAEVLIAVNDRGLEDPEPFSYVPFEKVLEYTKNVHDYINKTTEFLLLDDKVVFLEGDPNLAMEKVL